MTNFLKNKPKIDMFLSLAEIYRAAGQHDEANELVAKANELIFQGRLHYAKEGGAA